MECMCVCVWGGGGKALAESNNKKLESAAKDQIAPMCRLIFIFTYRKINLLTQTAVLKLLLLPLVYSFLNFINQF